VVVSSEVGESELLDLYIEDVDTNGNNLPDAWEMVNNRGRLDNGTENIDDTLSTGVIINKEITDNLQNYEGTSTVAGLASYVVGVLKNAGVAALAVDADTDAHSSYNLALRDATTGITVVANTTDVKVTAITADDTVVKLAIAGSATVTKTGRDGSAVTPASRFYTAAEAGSAGDEPVYLRGRVLYKMSLEEPEWVESDTFVDIEVNEDGSFSTAPFDVPENCVGKDKCFFRVKIEN